jgi:hypothetical protein
MTARMRELNLDDDEVADMAGLSKDTIRAYRRLPEARVHPTAENAAAVAKALKWTTDQLLLGTGVEIAEDDTEDAMSVEETETFETEIDRLKTSAAARLNLAPNRVTVTVTII